MKTKSILFLLFAISIAFTSCCDMNDDYVTPSGEITTVNHSVGGFSELDIQDAFNVYVTFSDDEESVQIEANANLHPYIEVSKNGDKLIVKLEDNINLGPNQATLNVHIRMHDLNEVNGAGATNFQFQNELIGNKLNVELTGACSLQGTIHVDELKATIIGGSSIDIAGSAQTFTVEAIGASDMESYGFETNKLEAELAGASNVSITVHENMDVKASGASSLFYKGDGQVSSQNLSGASQIVKVQ